MERSRAVPALAFAGLPVAFWFVARRFGVQVQLGGNTASDFFSFALLLAPYCAFGFGFGEWLAARDHGATYFGGASCS